MTDFDDDFDEEFDEEVDEDEDESLSAALAAEWGSAPWYVSSLAIHLIFFFILFLIPVSRPPKPAEPMDMETEIVDEEVEDEKEEEKPEIEVEEKEPVDEVVTDDVVVKVVTETDVKITDHEETQDDVEDDTAKGDPDNMASFDSEFTGTPATMGVGASGGGGGGGKFGNRGRGGRRRAVRRGGGSRKTENSVNWALKWLAEHQEYDGHWSCSKYGGSGSHAKGAQNTLTNGGDAAVTGLAMLAFLGAGNSVGFGKYRDNVKRAVEWLMTQQQPNGCIGVHCYVGGITLMAIAETYGMSQGHPLSKKIGIAAQKAVNWAVKSQCDKGGWNYSPNSTRNDQSVTGWWVMGLKSSYVAGLNVPTSTFTKARKFHLAWTDEYGKSGYTEPGKGSIRCSAIANTCLQFLGENRNSAKVIATAEAVYKNAPHDDFYLMYYQALGLFQMGTKSQYWLTFNEKMKTYLIGHQVMVGTVQNKKGSWDYNGASFGDKWGRVGQTGLGALMLEVYYRYKEGSKVTDKH